ncbi:MAG: class C sortase [Lachnospiraceae bacterium]|nr:class C sortase [Lachnospiraceae bacterium]
MALSNIRKYEADEDMSRGYGAESAGKAVKVHKRKKEKTKRKGRFFLGAIPYSVLEIGLVICFAALAYPTFSDWWNSKTQTHAIATYTETVDDMSEEEYTAMLEAAQAYNEMLYELGSSAALTQAEQIDEDYWDILDVSGTGIMGYITIDRINVNLPIYHGTDEGVLQIAAGHLEGSSLPIGGENTHSVISAHRGLPSSLLFTNLDKLEVGDTFTITVLDEVLTYEVDQITIVLPDEIEGLYIEEGKDYCTLMTCTPYGVNSHRLLVLLIWMIISARRRKKRAKAQEAIKRREREPETEHDTWREPR